MEKFKELGFTTCAIALACSNLVTFVMIAFMGYAPIITEGNPWVLYIEMALDVGFIAWGIERLRRDIKR